MKEGIFCPGRLGLELKGSVETFKEIVKEWTERDEECGDIEALLRCGGENWLLNTLVTDTDEGILPSSVEDRRHRFGSNKKEKPPLVKWWRLFIDALGDTTLLILIGCSVISIIVNLIFAPSEEKAFAWVEGLAILIAVLVCALVASTNDYQKAKKFQELYDIEHKKKEVEVIRAKKRISLHPEEIVVGDLIILRGGMEIQGDGILIQGNSIEIDESSMTGESEPQRKDILRRCMIEKEKSMKSVASPVLLAGTKALSGEGKYLVINVGKNSSMGSINSLVESKDDKTPLQEKLEALADRIGKAGLVFAILTFLALMIRLLVDILRNGSSWNSSKHPGQIVKAIIISITVVVVAIPEGLPLAVTLSLAYSVKEMLKENNLVRKLNACETMGGADCICSDKTGTLTKNEMTVTHFYNETLVKVYDMDTTKVLTLQELTPNKDTQDLLIDSIVANSSDDLVTQA